MEYLFTERAHLMCPGMCFGIALLCDAAFDAERIQSAASGLAAAHPFLRAGLGFEKERNAYYYDVSGQSMIELRIHAEANAFPETDVILREFEELTAREWDLSSGMLKISAWNAEGKTCFLMIFRHLLADGRGALGLAEELSDAYAGGIVPKHVREHLMTAADFPPESELPLFSRMLVDKANHCWEKEAHQPLSYEEYRKRADAWSGDHPVRHSLSEKEPAQLSELRRQCHAHGVTVNDVLMAEMMMEENTDKIIIAKDLRDRLPSFVPGALGNYSTAFSIEMSGRKEKDRTDVFALAEQIHAKVQKVIRSPRQLYLILQCYARLNPALLDAAFLSAVNAFESRSAAWIGKKFFGFASAQGYSITNLGRTENKGIVQAYFIPPASPAIRITLGVLTVNGVMTICKAERS